MRMKTPPIKPPRRPITNAPTKQSIPGEIYELPSLTISEAETLIGRSLFHICLKTDRVKVAMVEAKKTFHVKEKDQKVLGLDIS